MDGPGEREPGLGATEVWELYNTTADAHPMHIHEVAFEVVNRQGLVLDEEGEVVEPIQLDGDDHASRAVGDRASRTRSSPTRARSRG